MKTEFEELQEAYDVAMEEINRLREKYSSVLDEHTILRKEIKELQIAIQLIEQKRKYWEMKYKYEEGK